MEIPYTIIRFNKLVYMYLFHYKEENVLPLRSFRLECAQQHS